MFKPEVRSQNSEARSRFLSIFHLLSAIFCLVLATGCASNRLVPKSVLEVRGADGKSFRLELPKDMEAESISLTKDEGGLPTFLIQKIKVRTNPEVIGAAGAAQADAINAAGDVALKAFQAGQKLASPTSAP